MGVRRKGRECALQLLFQADLSDCQPSDFHELYWYLQRKFQTEWAIAHANDELAWELELPEREYPEIRRYADFLFFGTLTHRGDIDAVIQRFSEHWRIERMAVVDRNILRMAVFEFLHEPDTPTTVVINEALEIARTFSTEESTQFINGILDAINKNYLPGRQSG